MIFALIHPTNKYLLSPYYELSTFLRIMVWGVKSLSSYQETSSATRPFDSDVAILGIGPTFFCCNGRNPKQAVLQ